jgi:hypothetical protein
MSRSTPFELVFGGMRDRLDRLRDDLAAAGKDSTDRDVVLLEREAAELLRAIRPEEGFGEATDTFAALLHHAFSYREGREQVRVVAAAELGRVLLEPLEAGPVPGPPGSRYVQLPSLAIWAVLSEGPPEPIDGWFRIRRADHLDALAILGIRPGRAGFTALEVAGAPPGLRHRESTVPLFAPMQSEAGVPAGLAAVASEAELLELCWRVEALG